MPKIKFEAIKKPIGPRLQGINISYGDEILHFKPKSVGAAVVESPELLMSSPTLFMQNFEDSECKDLFEIYKEIYVIRDAPSISNETMFEIDEIMVRFFSIVTRERLEAWGKGVAPYVIAPSLGNIAPMRDGSSSHSCSEDEYLDLCIISTLFKLLIPFQEVSNHITEYLPDLVSDFWSLFSLLEGAGDITEYPAYQQLKIKARTSATSILGTDGVPTGLTAIGVGEEDFLKIILVPKLFRDITRLETEVGKFQNGINNNLSFKVSKTIDNYIRSPIGTMFTFGTNQGVPHNDDSEGNTTRNEMKAGGERISSIYGIYYRRDYDNIIEVTKNHEEFPSHLKMDENDVMQLAAKYPSRSIWTPSQHSIAGFIFDSVIPIDADEFCSPKSQVIILAYSALIAKKLKLSNLYALMICQEDGDGQLTESDRRNSVMSGSITHSIKEKVVANYPDTEMGNTFIEAVDNIVRGIIRTNYVISVNDPEYTLGQEWFPILIDDISIKDELAILTAHVLGLTSE